MNSLETLVTHRDTILLAEAIGWLHDYRKCSEGHIGSYADPAVEADKVTATDVDVVAPGFRNVQISLLGTSYSLYDTLHRRHRDDPKLPHYLTLCHKTSHIEKEEPSENKELFSGCQQYDLAQLCTPFGFEYPLQPEGLKQRLLDNIPWASLTSYTANSREPLRLALAELFTQVGADTRRPINEVSLWDWGMQVGSLLKSTIAGELLAGHPQGQILRWRLLNIRVDGLSYIFGTQRVPDVLARKELVSAALDRVRELLEVTYPLGNELYRDENGAMFVVPNLPELLDVEQSPNDKLTLRTLILDAFAGNHHIQDIGREIVPDVWLDAEAWYGQDPQWKDKLANGEKIVDEIPPVGRVLAKSVTAFANPATVREYWKDQSREICVVCGMRPQGPAAKSLERKVCDICERRRDDRSMKWATTQTGQTIWLDEVSDLNGRVALITGQFELSKWLNGAMFNTMMAVAPEHTTSNNGMAKNASISRMQRMWETTHRFWKETQCRIDEQYTSNGRLLVWINQAFLDLGAFHVYDLTLGETNLSMVWYPPRDGRGGYFISADNLGYVARQLGAETAIFTDQIQAIRYVEDVIRSKFILQKQQPVLRDPDAKGDQAKNALSGTMIIDVQYQNTPYANVIPLHTEPRTFMALVPAAKAFAITQELAERYSQEMGKVQNRLPIHLGIVYFHRRTPLRAALDAGHRMLTLERFGGEALWTVQADPAEMPNAVEAGQWTKALDVRLEQNHRTLTWKIPMIMGDGMTEDIWYPYIYVNDGNGQHLVHAKDLHAGDHVVFTPSTFDFEWLDSAARRFTIAYDGLGQRYHRQTRPYLLNELQDIQEAWEDVAKQNGLSASQVYALLDTIETRRWDWGSAPEDATFRQLCKHAICNAEWKEPLKKEDIAKLSAWAASGLLADTIELFMRIQKDKPKCDTTRREP